MALFRIAASVLIPAACSFATNASMFFTLALCGALSVRAAEPEDGGLDVVKVRKNFYMIAGAGGNIGVQIGSDGVVLVNSGAAAASDQVLAALKKLTDLPIRYIINVDAGADFVGGNEKLSKSRLHHLHQCPRQRGDGQAMTNGGGASILSHDSVLRRMSTGKDARIRAAPGPTRRSSRRARPSA